MTHVPLKVRRRGPTQPSPFERMLGADARADLCAVIDEVAALDSLGPSFEPDDIADFTEATSVLESAWAVVIDAISHSSGQNPFDVERTIEVLGRLRQMEITVRDAESRHHQETLSRVRPALARFQSIDSISQLMDLAPEVVCSLGFDRAIMSNVIDSKWVTHSAYVVGDETWAKVIARLGQDEPASLRGPSIPESEMVRRRIPVLVTGVQDSAHVYRPMADTTYARSYVAAPLTIQSQVVGFIHGDRYFHRGETTNFDRDVISAFAEGLSLAIERSTMKARLENLRVGLRQLAGEPSDNSGTTHPFESASALSRITPIASTSTTASSAEELEERLTRRELEIVRYLANGETNARIAARLVLSEDTVKTHVKHILRKLGASNRAEAVSKWLLASTVRR